jgi:hypothetical protein
MFKLLHYIFIHFSGLTWHTHSLSVLGGMDPHAEQWETLIVFFIVLTGAIILANIIQFICMGCNTLKKKESLKYYISLSFLYCILNIIINLIIVCFALTIGGKIALCIIGPAYFLLISIHAINQLLSGDSYATGIFSVIENLVDFSEDIGLRENTRKQYTQKYQAYLKLEY